ncbi:hypothetical protein BH11ACT8_BH11ACT8_12250 [soil metagenome]
MTTTNPTASRADAVDFLADAWRHKGRSKLADLVIAGCHLDYTHAERREALSRVVAELHADLVLIREHARLATTEHPDPVVARGMALLDLEDHELEHLLRHGMVDDLLTALDLDPKDYRGEPL